MENRNKETAYRFVGSFRILILSCKMQKKHVLQGKIGIRKLPTIVGSFRIWILSGKTPKNTCLAMENRNTETAYNCRQFPFLNL